MPYKDKIAQYEYQKLWSRRKAIENRQKVIKLLGGKCNWCGYNSNWIALQVDHKEPVLRVNGHRLRDSGNMTVKQILMGKITLNSIQLLCANCHSIKTYDDRVKYGNYDKPRSKR